MEALSEDQNDMVIRRPSASNTRVGWRSWTSGRLAGAAHRLLRLRHRRGTYGDDFAALAGPISTDVSTRSSAWCANGQGTVEAVDALRLLEAVGKGVLSVGLSQRL